MAEKFAEDVIEELLARLERGEGLKSICADPRMPDRRTVHRWMRGDDELAVRIMEARELGFHVFAEETLELVEKCPDPHKARVLFDARRWHLGKLSQAFADKPVVIGALVNVDVADTFDGIARVLDQAAGAISSRSERTVLLADEGTPGAGDADG